MELRPLTSEVVRRWLVADRMGELPGPAHVAKLYSIFFSPLLAARTQHTLSSLSEKPFQMERYDALGACFRVCTFQNADNQRYLQSESVNDFHK